MGVRLVAFSIIFLKRSPREFGALVSSKAYEKSVTPMKAKLGQLGVEMTPALYQGDAIPNQASGAQPTVSTSAPYPLL